LCDVCGMAWLSYSPPLRLNEPNLADRRGDNHARQTGENARARGRAQGALPFEVELASEVGALLRTRQPPVVVKPQQIVSQISFAGDESGIVCHILPEETESAVVISMTHVRMGRKNPLAPAVFARGLPR
jgi:hypothetical protein